MISLWFLRLHRQHFSEVFKMTDETIKLKFKQYRERSEELLIKFEKVKNELNRLIEEEQNENQRGI